MIKIKNKDKVLKQNTIKLFIHFMLLKTVKIIIYSTKLIKLMSRAYYCPNTEFILGTMTLVLTLKL